jgi:hypothetical protein
MKNDEKNGIYNFSPLLNYIFLKYELEKNG